MNSEERKAVVIGKGLISSKEKEERENGRNRLHAIQETDLRMQFEQETDLREWTAGNTYSILWKSLVSENLHIAKVFGSQGPY